VNSDEDSNLIKDEVSDELRPYIDCGANLGQSRQSPGMRRFVLPINSKILMMDVTKMHKQVCNVGKILSHYDHRKIYVCTNNKECQKIIIRFCELTGFKTYSGRRFSPGTFTNKESEFFFEPQIVLTVNGVKDKLILKECLLSNIPTIAFCDTDDSLSGIDYVLPSNNKSVLSVSLIFYKLYCEILKNQNSENIFPISFDEFKGDLTNE